MRLIEFIGQPLARPEPDNYIKILDKNYKTILLGTKEELITVCEPELLHCEVLESVSNCGNIGLRINVELGR